MEKIITMANGSASSLYGCMSIVAQNLILSKFPPGYFKYLSLSTELATRNIRRSFGTNTNTEIAKREKPYLIIQPTYSVSELNGPLQNIPLTSNFDDITLAMDKRYLFKVIQDKKNLYSLKFKMNRDKIEFNVTMTVSTLHQQLDLYRALMNQIMWETTSSKRVALEAVIPRHMVYLMGKLCNMNIEENEDYIPILTKRLNACSGYPITYKMRTASQNDEWYMYYTHNTYITFSDLSIDEGSMKNMAPDSYNITFRVTTEFNMPGLFLIDSEKPDIPADVIISASVATSNYPTNKTIIPMAVIENIYSRYPQEKDGMQLYGTTIFNTTANGALTDSIKFDKVLEKDYISVISAHKTYYNSPDSLIRMIILKDSEELIPNTDFRVDWNKYEIIMNKPDDKATYRLIMYFNMGMVNEILSNTNYNRNYDISKLDSNPEILYKPNEPVIPDTDGSDLPITDTPVGGNIIPETINDDTGIVAPEDTELPVLIKKFNVYNDKKIVIKEDKKEPEAEFGKGKKFIIK